MAVSPLEGWTPTPPRIVRDLRLNLLEIQSQGLDRAVEGHSGSPYANGVLMAELTNLEAKLGEVTGLAMAAQAATKKVLSLADGENAGVAKRLQQMHDEATETESRCTALVSSFEGKKTAILAEAKVTKGKGAEMMSTYLDVDSDLLDGFEFLTMAEAAEVGHWSILGTLAKKARHSELTGLVDWALPIQQGHFSRVMEGSLKLAAEEDPNEPA